MEVITGGGQHGVNGIAGMVCKIIAAHAVLGLEMTDHWFDGGAPPHSRLICGVSRRFMSNSFHYRAITLAPATMRSLG